MKNSVTLFVFFLFLQGLIAAAVQGPTDQSTAATITTSDLLELNNRDIGERLGRRLSLGESIAFSMIRGKLRRAERRAARRQRRAERRGIVVEPANEGDATIAGIAFGSAMLLLLVILLSVVTNLGRVGGFLGLLSMLLSIILGAVGKSKNRGVNQSAFTLSNIAMWVGITTLGIGILGFLALVAAFS
ncbi:MAG: hypothetical protein AAF433_01495 [Bacteroidota bacterium]